MWYKDIYFKTLKKKNIKINVLSKHKILLKKGKFIKTYSIYNNEIFYYNIYQVKALEFGNIKKLEIEAFKKLIKSFYKKIKFRINIFYFSILTKKPIETRMGKGKGKFLDRISLVKPGQIIFEFWVKGGPERIINEALKKINIKTSLIQYI